MATHRARWHQHNIEFSDRSTAEQVSTEIIGPALDAAQCDGDLHGWWFLNKQPWPLRYRREGAPSTTVENLLDSLTADGRVVRWTTGIYEPETHAFGGPSAVEAAHELFHHDSHHLLTQSRSPSRHRPGRRETAILLCSAMLRAAGLDWYEQGDVWAKVSDLRPVTHALPAERIAALASAMRLLMTADLRSLCDATGEGPFSRNGAWVTAFEQAGRTLRHLAQHGELTRGLRAVLAHHVIFHNNRAGLPLEEQGVMSALAKEAVMGTSDNPVSPPAGSPPISRTESTTDTTTEVDGTAARLRNALVDQIVADYRVAPRIEQALRTVPRHLFVPDATLEEAYANSTVDIKRDATGQSISCASQPVIVGIMLEQLQPQPGHRILELGAGTGYNAGLLAHLVGESGHVTTMDVDEDLVEGARSHLAAAGIGKATVVCGDGALGHPDSAPYDRIIATVGAHGVPHAWMQQLAAGGRLLVPQRLRGSVSRSIAYEQRDGSWVSVSSEMNTFMPLRRGIADDTRQVIPVTSKGSVRLQTNSEQLVDAQALSDVLDQPRTVVWSDVFYRAMESPEWMELWLTCTLPSGLNQMPASREAVETGLLTEPYPSSTAVFEKGALTYLTRRLSDQRTPEGGKLWEFGVVGHGPGGDELATQVAESMRTWDREYRNGEARFEIHPLDAAPVRRGPGCFSFDTPLNRIVVQWQ
ncbi:methyltransferase, FxLD system [Streptomyces sp. S07_1.15]|uniref:methyltransferase, FxLD system n=1 Tax=Streptomyces sp. S07_1.15 TaxID=2873925 RepID=UPI001D13D3DC|nr:methyltransferase, FxLD system [Streptomyces sp. S07_1.15]MCC3650754.1 methyltransferase, FxLD system [Streptomyces sp. S07_1.15]